MAWMNLERLLSSAPLEEVAKRLGMELSKSGSGHLTLCPFHPDHKPSLKLFPAEPGKDAQYHCFSCNEHGNAIELVKQIQGVGFEDAVAWLASTFGVPYEETKKSSTSKFNRGSALKYALSLYQANQSEAVMAAWAESRHFPPGVLEKLGLLYARSNTLTRAIAALPLNEALPIADELQEVQVIRKLYVRSDTPSLHLPLDHQWIDDFPDDRIIIPLRATNGSLVGFAGRRVTEQATERQTPKYLITRGIEKGQHLYNADQAFALVRKISKTPAETSNLYIVEGFLDALRLHSLGIPAVALMGTSLTQSQSQLIEKLAESLPPGKTLSVKVFLDRDAAGYKATARIVRGLLTRLPFSEIMTVLFTGNQASAEGLLDEKDPDACLSAVNSTTAQAALQRLALPAVAALLMDEFAATAPEDLTDARWREAAPYRKDRALFQVLRSLAPSAGDAETRLMRITGALVAVDKTQQPLWLQQLLTASRIQSTSRGNATFAPFITSEVALINHARALAYHGARRGELPCAEPEWERLDVAATVFNVLLKERVSQRRFEQSMPFDAVQVPRKLTADKDTLNDPRLKAMPRPIDLALHQYVMNELLTERHDMSSLSSPSFSSCIPAVRFFRATGTVVTTGGAPLITTPQDEEVRDRVLSFGYQIDMEVLEGLTPPTDQGMFRPYMQCWRAFMQSLREQATNIGQVHSLRLDARRYYDNIRQFVVRDTLTSSLRNAVAVHSASGGALPDILQPNATDDAVGLLVDALCTCLFGFDYYQPDHGRVEQSSSNIGIPQGPVMSAWIGSIVMFTVDHAAREVMARHNTAERWRVGYARYVDDIVLLADSAALLTELREAVQTAAEKLELILLAKGDPIPVTDAERFFERLNDGRVFAGSGPTWEPPMVGDGELGWGLMDEEEDVTRQSALQILRHPSLLSSPGSTVQDAVKRAFSASDLRPGELGKAARWIWFAIAMDSDAHEKTSVAIWAQFWERWDAASGEQQWAIALAKKGYSLFAALEGLERVLDNGPLMEQGLDQAALQLKKKCMRRFAMHVAEKSFFEPVANALIRVVPHQIRRRIALIQWKANRQTDPSYVERPEKAETTAAERSLGAWLDMATGLLMAATQGPDPLNPLQNVTKEKWIELPEAYALHRALLGDLPESTEIRSLALQFIVAATPPEAVWRVLGHRPGLLGSTVQGKLIPFPPLPGIRSDRLLAYLEGSKKATISLRTFAFSGASEPVERLFGASHDMSNAAPPLQISWSDPLKMGAGLNQRTTNSDLALSIHTDDPADHRLQSVIPNEGRANFAARLFNALLTIHDQHSNESSQTTELVPTWPYLAYSGSKDSQLRWYLIAEPVKKEDVKAQAFVRDGGRSLRSVVVPSGESHLWRIGYAVSDLLGLSDDFYHSDSGTTSPIGSALSLDAAEDYVLRTQMRKLRGEFLSAGALQRPGVRNIGLPLTVERAVKILEDFPNSAAGEQARLFALLETETETRAMWLRLHDKGNDALGLRKRMHILAIQVLGRLPAAAASALASQPIQTQLLRKDLHALLSIGNAVMGFESWAKQSHVASEALCGAIGLAATAWGFRGVVASVLARVDKPIPSQYSLPQDWPEPDAERLSVTTDYRALATALNDDDWAKLEEAPAMGWLLVLTTLLETELRNTAVFGEARRHLKEIYLVLLRLESLSSETAADQPSWAWPFEDLPSEGLRLHAKTLLSALPTVVQSLDVALGFVVQWVRGSRYTYDPKERRFTDSRANRHDMRRGQITQLPFLIRSVEESKNDQMIMKAWTEVRARGSEALLSVHVVSESLARMAFGVSRGQVADSQARTVTSVLAAEQESPPVAEIDGTPEIEAHNNAKFRKERHSTTGAIDSTVVGSEGTDNLARSAREAQQASWSSRKNTKSKAHMRVALLQWRLDESYSHPLNEAGLRCFPVPAWARGELDRKIGETDLDERKLLAKLQKAQKRHEEYRWGDTEQVISWAEYRRRSFLTEALRACRELEVDLLVLPEISVRPETVQWLKGEMPKYKDIAVLAGTYRDPDSLSAEMHLLWSMPRPTEELLWPIQNEQVRVGSKSTNGVVLAWNRSKKYRAVAVNEFIRPNREPLKPLFSPEEFVQKLEAEGLPLVNAKSISSFMHSHLPSMRFCQELICSELFMLTSPANLISLGEDYDRQLRRFSLRPESSAREAVKEDVEMLGVNLAIEHRHETPRRSVLLIPAATSRSSDYWISGQASLLASGVSTVFCNGVAGSHFVGGSCFIGHDCSKEHSSPTVGLIERTTPYHGWSKGIYYGNRDEPLSRRDQALVVADIDPLHMVEGKPRPQLLPVPMALVAYLPIVELIDPELNAQNMAAELSTPLSTSLEELLGSVLLDSGEASCLQRRDDFWRDFEMLNKLARSKKLLGSIELDAFAKRFSDPKSVVQRLHAWERDRSQQPASEVAPPALLDFLTVDLTLNKGEPLPTIRVPAWKGENG